jgi:branched-subunit amino acid aminotransferase/4-amino-4-deoxychorismate lyase
LEDAKRKGFNEAVRLNEKGEVVSAIMANLFWIKDGKTYTPPLKTGCLAGTIREFVMENQSVEEKIIGWDELLKADEIFLTSNGIYIKNIADIDGKSFGNKFFLPIFSRFPDINSRFLQSF